MSGELERNCAGSIESNRSSKPNEGFDGGALVESVKAKSPSLGSPPQASSSSSSSELPNLSGRSLEMALRR